MILISYGMMKSASSFVCHITLKIAGEAGHDQDRIRREYLPEELRPLWGPIGDRDSAPPAKGSLLYIDRIAELIPDEAVLVIKTHSPPPACTARLLAENRLKATICSRDPRDVAVSMLDHGARDRRPGARNKNFAQIETMEHALRAAKKNMGSYREWAALSPVLPFPYPLIKRDPFEVARQIADFLAVTADTDAIVRSFLDGTIPNFNVGVEGRHREIMTPEELEQADEMFGDFRG